jgi:hypothetical protein
MLSCVLSAILESRYYDASCFIDKCPRKAFVLIRYWVYLTPQPVLPLSFYPCGFILAFLTVLFYLRSLLWLSKSTFLPLSLVLLSLCSVSVSICRSISAYYVCLGLLSFLPCLLFFLLASSPQVPATTTLPGAQMSGGDLDLRRRG